MTSSPLAPPFDGLAVPADWAAGPLPGTATRVLAAPSGECRLTLVWPAGQAPALGWPLLVMAEDAHLEMARALAWHHAGAPQARLAVPGVILAIGYVGPSRREHDFTPGEDDGQRPTSPIAPEVAAGAIGHPEGGSVEPGRAGGHVDPTTAGLSAAALAGPGGAPAFLAWLADTVLPIAHEALPLDASRRTFAGHSLGGLLGLQSCLRQPGLFATYLLSSPSVWWGNGRAAQLAAAAVASPVAGLDARVCLTVGEYEQALSPDELTWPDRDRIAAQRQGRAMVDRMRALAAVLATVPGVRLDFRVIEAETHRSVIPRALDLGVRVAFAPWAVAAAPSPQRAFI